METPFVGKKADVLNKRGTVALFNRNEDEAMRFWQEAKALNDKHFDSTCNHVMYKWSTGRITDGQMMSELGEFVFDHGHKGQCLQAYLNLAIGNLDEGHRQLKTFVEETRNEMNATRVKNVKVQKYLDQAERMYDDLTANLQYFQSSWKCKHSHNSEVKSISFSNSGRYMCTVTSTDVQCWVIDQVKS